MSEVVERFPLPAHARYDWPSLFDGQIRKFERGVDFTTSPIVFVKAAQRWGYAHDFAVRTRVIGDCVWLQANPRPARGAPGRPKGQLMRVG